MGDEITTYEAAARSISLNLNKFCDKSKNYPDMIACAVRAARDRNDQLEAENAQLKARNSELLNETHSIGSNLIDITIERNQLKVKIDQLKSIIENNEKKYRHTVKIFEEVDFKRAALIGEVERLKGLLSPKELK